MLKRLLLAFARLQEPHYPLEPRQEPLPLRWGRFYTKRDVDARFDRLKNFTFVG